MPVKVKRKDHINSAARNLFRERGYSATSMRDIASTVGIEVASLYNHIDSKESMLQQICFTMAEKFLAIIPLVKHLQERPEEQLKEAIRLHVLVITSHADESAVFVHEWKHLSEPHLSAFKKMRNNYEGFYRDLIRRGEELGLFKNIHEKFVMMVLFSSINWLYDYYKPNGKLNPSQISDIITDIFLNGIKNN
ncbi:MAG: TetR/AcrR family transcriptional regulator [Bacteroidetes bacterium]|nr:TetR/AcrR family transcriptional regulator [Bacteroidota bacterium]